MFRRKSLSSYKYTLKSNIKFTPVVQNMNIGTAKTLHNQFNHLILCAAVLRFIDVLHTY